MSIQPAGIIPEWTICDRLRKARETTGLDQAQFAKRIDISRSTVGNYEAGRVAPRRIVLKQWALATGVNVEWLETGVAPHNEPDDGGMVNLCYPSDNVVILPAILTAAA